MPYYVQITYSSPDVHTRRCRGDGGEITGKPVATVQDVFSTITSVKPLDIGVFFGETFGQFPNSANTPAIFNKMSGHLVFVATDTGILSLNTSSEPL